MYDDDIDNCDENFETTGDFVDVNGITRQFLSLEE